MVEITSLEYSVPVVDFAVTNNQRKYQIHLGGESLNDSPRIIVVGGVAAGASAAAKARRTNENAHITVYEKGPFVSFANCGLPYYVAKEIVDQDSLLVTKPEVLSGRFDLTVKTNHEVVSIDAAARTVVVRDPSGNELIDHYDKLILATGSSPIRPRLPGIDGPDIHTLTTVPDAVQIRKLLDGRRNRPHRAVIIGLGAIGLEVAEALLKRRLDVTLVDLAPQVLPLLDPEMAAPIAVHLQQKGAKLVLGDGIAAFHSPTPNIALLSSGRQIPFDIAILSIGVRPNLELARSAGLAIGQAGGVVVDSKMLTSDPHIYAAGDIVESTHMVTGRKLRMPMAGPANRQGRVAGTNAAGGAAHFGSVLGTFIVRVGDVTAGKTGIGEREAKQEGIDHIASLSHSANHATYYPGSHMLAIKVVADRSTGRLLGAQVTGRQGVDKRLDVFATAVAAGMTLDDLAELDFAYAPPYGSARDPVQMAAMAAGNVRAGKVKAMTPAALRELMSQPDHAPVQVLDVRTAEEHAKGAVAGAINLPLEQLRSRLQELTGFDPNGLLVVHCRSGQRSYVAARILAQRGFRNVVNLSGGYLSYLADLDAQRVAAPPATVNGG